jgi:hypothetical protein
MLLIVRSPLSLGKERLVKQVSALSSKKPWLPVSRHWSENLVCCPPQRPKSWRLLVSNAMKKRSMLQSVDLSRPDESRCLCIPGQHLLGAETLSALRLFILVRFKAWPAPRLMAREDMSLTIQGEMPALPS